MQSLLAAPSSLMPKYFSSLIIKVIPWEGAWTTRKGCPSAMCVGTNCRVMPDPKETAKKFPLHISTNSRYSEAFSLKPKHILIWQVSFVLMLAEKEREWLRKESLFLCAHNAVINEVADIWSMDIPTGTTLVAAWCPWATDVWSWCWCPICPAIEADGEQQNIPKLLELYHPGAQRGRQLKLENNVIEYFIFHERL